LKYSGYLLINLQNSHVIIKTFFYLAPQNYCSMKIWYEELFVKYACKYDQEPFTQGTKGEVDFIEKEIGTNKTVHILDIGCGTGRHAIELAKRGYKVTGIDLSMDQLARAREKAGIAGLDIEFIQKDACLLDFDKEFELAIMICEGAFPLMETDEKNYMILQGAYKALKPGGKLIFTTLSALYPLFHSVKDLINSSGSDVVSGDNSFNLLTFRETSWIDVVDDNEDMKRLHCNERYYAPSEIMWLLKSLGFVNTGIYGCRLGAFSRNDALSTGDYEMLVISEKPQ
jgi:SAM-dependent methyltransferase